MVRSAGRLVVAAILATVSPVASVPAHADMAALEKAARKEGEVTWYVASIDAQSAEAAGRAFTAKYGPKVNVIQAPAPVTFQRLTQDLAQKAPSADVFSSVNVGHFVTLKQNGALLAYKAERSSALLPAFQALDKDSMFHSTVASVVVIAYNKDKVEPSKAPRNWTDINDPQWSGKIVLGHPAFSGFAGNWAAQMHRMYGEPFFRRLKAQKPQVARSAQDAIDLVASGERWITAVPITPILEGADKGKPLAIVYPTDGAILVATPSAVLKSAPHPSAAKLFMEFLLGPEFGKILVNAHHVSVRADVPSRYKAKPVTEIKTIRPSIEDSIKGVQQVAELWRSMFEQ